jgi:hypothetical protein
MGASYPIASAMGSKAQNFVPEYTGEAYGTIALIRGSSGGWSGTGGSTWKKNKNKDKHQREALIRVCNHP